MNLHISSKWSRLQHSIKINERYIVLNYEEVMIKNQMLNVSFDDLCAEKNNRKNLYE